MEDRIERHPKLLTMPTLFGDKTTMLNSLLKHSQSIDQAQYGNGIRIEREDQMAMVTINKMLTEDTNLAYLKLTRGFFSLEYCFLKKEFKISLGSSASNLSNKVNQFLFELFTSQKTELFEWADSKIHKI
jgi:hypothetical protein